MQFHAQVSEDLVIGLDVPGPVRIEGFSIDIPVSSEAELREVIERFGGVDVFTMNPTSNLVSRYGVPVTCDGERVAKMAVHLWLRAGLRQPTPIYEPIQRILEERKAAHA